MSEEIPWTHPEVCPHCQSCNFHRDEDQSTYDCGTVMIALDDFPAFECFQRQVAKLKAKIEAMEKAGDAMAGMCHRDHEENWNKAKEIK